EEVIPEERITKSGHATVVGIDLKQEIGFLGNLEIIGAKSWSAQRRSLQRISGNRWS
ncbi:hypothetical protein U1Q18_009565, partial [Sarracenia purpurea var. burkii]